MKKFALIFGLLAIFAVAASKPTPACQCENCTCDPCTCQPGECKCQLAVKPIDDSGKGYVTVIVPPGYNGWALTWATPELKKQNHYTVLSTKSPLYRERFAKTVPTAPCILLQKANGQVVDKLYSKATASCCPWKRRNQEVEEEEAPVPEKELEAEIKKEEDHPGPYILACVAGLVVGTAGAWHYRKTTPMKKS